MATLLLAEVANGRLSDIIARALTAAARSSARRSTFSSPGKDVAEAAAAAAKLAGVARCASPTMPLYAHGLAEPLAALLVALAPDYDAIVAASTAVRQERAAARRRRFST